MTLAAGESQQTRKGWGRFVVYLLYFIGFLLLSGFITFAHSVDNLTQPETVPMTDGIVVWTGKGGDRLAAGADLLVRGKGERLLISGVNAKNSRETIINVLGLSEPLSSCCVDLDYNARDTIGNARETANWTRAMGYDHIILVTSAYHMPRAEIEIAASRSDIIITPYPVFSDEPTNWWRNPERFRQIVIEYGKLIMSLARLSGKRGT